MLLHRLRTADSLLVKGQYLFGLRIKLLPCRGQDHLPPGMAEQLHLQLLFQCPDLLRQRRLRHEQRLRCFGKTFQLHDLYKALQRILVHRLCSSPVFIISFS